MHKRLMDLDFRQNIEKELNDAAQEAINRNQREYYLREEMKAIQAELGEDDDIETYRAKIEALPVSDEIRERLNKELGRLAKQPSAPLRRR